MNPDVLQGLRRLFLEGTTFSGILRYLQQINGGKVAQGAFRLALVEAFGHPFQGGIPVNTEDPANDAFYALLGAHLIPEIVASRSQWESGSETGSKPWFDDLPDTAEGRESPSHPGRPPAGLGEEAWASLSPAEQERVGNLERENRALWERVLLFARLAEQLQRRASELEARLGEPARQGASE